jgi:hypothetical protein
VNRRSGRRPGPSPCVRQRIRKLCGHRRADSSPTYSACQVRLFPSEEYISFLNATWKRRYCARFQRTIVRVSLTFLLSSGAERGRRFLEVCQ